MFYSSAPARVCLYGEHQDYLQLKVIPAAVDLRLEIFSDYIDKNIITVESKSTGKTAKIKKDIVKLSDKKISFSSYLEAGIIVLKKAYKEIEIPSLNVRVMSNIPIASGLSSSAALLVGWIKHLSGILQLETENRKIAELAYQAEHDILGVPCGKMDQYASTYGNIISLICTKNPELKKLQTPDFELLVVDSQIPKFTSDVHSRKVKEIKRVIASFEKKSNISLEDATTDIVSKLQHNFEKKDYKTLKAVVSIKEDTEKAEKELMKSKPNLEKLGNLLTSQQNALKEGISVSLPLLDKIIDLGIKYGALGGKLTGAGLGGCVVLLTSLDKEKIRSKLKQVLNLPVWSVKIDKGAMFEEIKAS